MKIAIIGSRRYENKKKIKDFIFKLKKEYGTDTIIVILIDLNSKKYNSLHLCEKIKKNHGIPVFGVLDMFSKKMQEDAKT